MRWLCFLQNSEKEGGQVEIERQETGVLFEGLWEELKSPTKRMWGRLGRDYTGSSNSAHRKWAKFSPEVHRYELRKASVTISQSRVELTFTIGG